MRPLTRQLLPHGLQDGRADVGSIRAKSWERVDLQAPVR